MKLTSLPAAMLAFLLPSLALAWEGKVVGIADGDTITVMHDGHGEKIRLYGIDTPERHQDASRLDYTPSECLARLGACA